MKDKGEFQLPLLRPRMGLEAAVGSAGLFKEEGEYRLFLERIFHWTCIQALLSSKDVLEPWGSQKAENISCFALWFYSKQGRTLVSKERTVGLYSGYQKG